MGWGSVGTSYLQGPRPSARQCLEFLKASFVLDAYVQRLWPLIPESLGRSVRPVRPAARSANLSPLRLRVVRQGTEGPRPPFVSEVGGAPRAVLTLPRRRLSPLVPYMLSFFRRWIADERCAGRVQQGQRWWRSERPQAGVLSGCGA